MADPGRRDFLKLTAAVAAGAATAGTGPRDARAPYLRELKRRPGAAVLGQRALPPLNSRHDWRSQ